MIKSIISPLLFILLLSQSTYAQDVLTKTLNANFEDVTIEIALANLNTIPDINLSYSPAILPKGKIKQSFINMTLETILSSILGEGYEFKSIGSYVIIQKSIHSNQHEKTTFRIAGGVVDAETGETLKDVTIYEINTLNSTLSNSQGDFDLTVSAKSDYVTFAISRENYEDTIIQVSKVDQLNEPILLNPRQEKINQFKSNVQVESKRMVQFFTTSKNRKNVRNVSNVQERYFQFSLIPAVGTNMTMGGQVKHELSLNLLAGYSYGLNGFELGGLYNIDRHNVKGFQVGGVGNTVGGKVKGLQIGGVLNTNRGYTSGVQIGGALNVVTNDMKGVQIAGFANTAKSFNGTQIGGFSCVATEDFKGLQLSGFNNHTRTLNGMQLSGFINTAVEMKGFQLSGAINTANEADGLQMSGFINIAKNLKGTQLSIFNYADTVTTGIPIGLISIVKKNGYFEAALENGDVIDLEASLRTGLKKFYNIISVGTQINSQNLWSYGFGFGSQIPIYKKAFTSIELRSHYLSSYEDESTNDAFFNLLTRFQITGGYQFFNHLSITAGPVLNIYVSNETSEGSGVYGYDIANKPFYDTIEEGTSIQMWVGFTSSIRF
ncbi:MAG: carboxypeptidase-like regulatory domain-containing protein [Reichenbachiella sp.]